MTVEKKWADLSPEEKRKERFKRWLSPDVKFSSTEAEKAYKARLTRIIDTIQLREPDRVPVNLPVGYFPTYYAGITLRTAMYDYDELHRAWLNFMQDFDDMDTFGGPGLVFPGRVSELVDNRISKWPGHGLPNDARFHQFVEGEYMKADEYDVFLNDPTDFCLRFYLPRTLAALEPFQRLFPFTQTLGMPTNFLLSCIMPDVQAAFQTIVAAGKELEKWWQVVDDCDQKVTAAGFPSLRGGMAHAPFDTFADTLRGTRGIFMDIYRQPEKLLEAMEKLTPMNIEGAVLTADVFGGPIIFMPLHKGDDNFMSDEQYQTFYWPTLKKVILGLVEEGLVPLLFAEGSYNRRLEVIKDLPRGAVVWHFDQTDMARAKEVLGDVACLAGNVPASLVCTGTPQAVKECCRQLIEVCGKGGGYILTGGASVDKCNPDNLRAMMAAAREYGTY